MASDITYNLGTKLTPPERVYLFGGPEKTLKQMAVRQLIHTCVDPDFQDFDYEELDAESADIDRILSSIETIPFASKKRVVIVQSLEKCKHLDKLANHLPKVPESTCLVLVASAVDSRRKTIVSEKFDSAVKKEGVLVRFPSLDPQSLTQVLSKRAAKFGTPIDRSALTMLIDIAGPELVPLRLELDKLSAYAGNGNKITSAIVDILTPKSPEANVFSLVDAVATGNPVPALATLKEMLDNGERAESAAPKIIGLVARQFRLIAQARFLLDHHYLPGNLSKIPESVTNQLPDEINLIHELGRKTWLLGKVTQQARNFSRKKVNEVFSRILKTDLTIKGIEGSIDNSKLALELMLVDLCRIAVSR